MVWRTEFSLEKIEKEHEGFDQMPNLTFCVGGKPYPRLIVGGDHFIDYWGPQGTPALNSKAGVEAVLSSAVNAGARGLDISMNDHVIEAFCATRDALNGELVGFANPNWKLRILMREVPLWNFREKVVATVVGQLGLSRPKIDGEQPGAWAHWFTCGKGVVPLTSSDIASWTLDEADLKARLRQFNGIAKFCLVGSDFGDWCIALGRIDILEQHIDIVRGFGLDPVSITHWPSITLPVWDRLDVIAHWVMASADRALIDKEGLLQAIGGLQRPLTLFRILGAGRHTSEIQFAFKYARDVFLPDSIVVGVTSPEEAIESFGIAARLFKDQWDSEKREEDGVTS